MKHISGFIPKLGAECRVDSRGVARILEYPLTAGELAQLRLSAEYLQTLAAQVMVQSDLQ